MPNVAQVLKEEILRLARKEAKAQITPLKKARDRDRKVAAGLRKQIASQNREIARLASALKRQAAISGAAAPELGGEKWRKDTVRSTRHRLGLTQKDFASLVGVSPLSVWGWEAGRTLPRQKQRAAVLEVRQLTSEEAAARLASPRSRRKARTHKA